jgi:hypothetical protein
VPGSAFRFRFRFSCGRIRWASRLAIDRSAHHAHFVHYFVPVHRFAADRGGIDARGVTCGYDDDGDIGEGGIAPLHGAKRPPVHQWHREVKEDQLRRESHAKELEGFMAVRGCDRGEPRHVEALGHHLAEFRVILDDENRVGHSI